MATSYKKTIVQGYPVVGEKITRDTLYWKQLEFPITRKERGAVTHIDFSPVEPYNFAVSWLIRVHLFSKRTNQPARSFTHFKTQVYGATYRNDGKLVTCGSADGTVRVLEPQHKLQLRNFKGHKSPVQCTRFLSDNLRIVSGSDDMTVKLWDIETQEETMSYAEHQDYVRCCAVSAASKDIFVTGSYDHTVKLYDSRTSESVFTVDHGEPVDSLLMYPSGGIILSAGGNTVKVWDALAGGRLLTKFSNHHKSITCMCFCSNYQRFVTGSIDRHVKIYDVSSYQVVHTLDYPSAITSVAVAPDDSAVVVGTVDGLLSIQHRTKDESAAKNKPAKEKASFRYKLRRTFEPAPEDHHIVHKRKEHLTKYDKFFKRFNYTKALDAALDLRVRRKTPEVTIGVMQELIRRGGLRSALAGRDDQQVGHVFKFVQRNISNPRFTSVLIDVSNMMLEIYASEVGRSSELDEHLIKLRTTIEYETSYMKMLLETMGTLDTLFAAAQRRETSNEASINGLQPNDETTVAS